MLLYDEDELREMDIQFHEDDRAQRRLNIFPELDGQVNVSHVNSTDHIVAWHKHKQQTDYWTCIKGSFKVGLAYPVKDEDGYVQHEVKWHYLSDKNPKALKIPPKVYHGYKALEPGSILLYGLTHKYNPKDEFRKEVGAFGENWKTENK